MKSPIRVRFAPSPTGYLHVGGLRTALYNFLFARHHGGKFILRIEDTDQSRKVEGAVENLITSLHWAGIEFDEGPGKMGAYGPYVQSERLEIYRVHAEQLVREGKAYYCFCTPERLDELRTRQTAEKLPQMYDRHCRELSREESAARAAAGERHVIRMKIPVGGELVFEDIIRGRVSIAYKVLDDQVLLKSDGFPTYHLAVVVDDHLMGISHVIRGEEWLPSTPKHILLYNYFDWELPNFAHLPLLLNPDKSKLSKRQGDVAVEDYRAKGYLPEAMVNFVAFLGWNPGDERELFSIEELIREFKLERVQKAGAVFNLEKLNWLNQQHIMTMSDDRLAGKVKPLLDQQGIRSADQDYLRKAVGLLKERMPFTKDFIETGMYFFIDPDSYDEKGRAKHWAPGTGEAMKALAVKFDSVPEFTHDALENELRTLAESLGVPATKLIHPTRLAVSGRTAGPGLFELLVVLGRERVVRRLKTAAERLG